VNEPTSEQILVPEARITWTRNHRDVSYEVVYWGHGRQGRGREPRGNWNYYLVLPERRWAPEDFAAFVRPRNDWRLGPDTPLRTSWDYLVGPIAELDWAGGITFYEVVGEAPNRAVRAGCDYDHAWNDDMGYWGEHDGVDYDARRCIDSLLTAFTPILTVAKGAAS
jgi:hypothetical protein